MRFRLPVFYLAGNKERGEPPDRLTLSVMKSALRDCATHGDFVDRLEGAESEFWIAVRTTLVTIAEETQITV